MKKADMRNVGSTVDTSIVAPLDSRKRSTKELLIDVGEQLFGQRGFDGVSLREIASSAQQSNSNVVQYHFGDKPGLISAILQDRVIHAEQVRCMQLAMFDIGREVDPRQLLKILWIPLMAIRDETGAHSFCRFMLQYMLHPKLAAHPLAGIYNPSVENAQDGNFPCGRKATQLLFARYAEWPQALIRKRLSTLATMFLASVVEHDNKRWQDGSNMKGAFDIEPILDMAIAALAAPV